MAPRVDASTFPHVAVADGYADRAVGAFEDLLGALRAGFSGGQAASLVGAASPEFTAGLIAPEVRVTKALTEASLAELFADIATEAGTARAGFSASFSQVRDASVAYARQQAAELVTGINAGTKTLIADIIARGQEGDLTWNQMAAEIRPLIGLTPGDAQAALNYRAALQKRVLDQRYGKDSAATLGRQFSLSPWQGGKLDGRVEDLYKRYVDRLLRERAVTIARTETIKAASAGEMISWQATIDDGGADGYLVTREWSTTRDDRACKRCMALDGEKRTTAPISETWRPSLAYDGGFAGVPHPPLHPRCRCVILTTMELAPVVPGQKPPAKKAPAAAPVKPALPLFDESAVAGWMTEPPIKLQARLKNSALGDQDRADITEARRRLLAAKKAAPTPPAKKAAATPAPAKKKAAAKKTTAKKATAAAPAKKAVAKTPAKKKAAAVKKTPAAKKPPAKKPVIKPDPFEVEGWKGATEQALQNMLSSGKSMGGMPLTEQKRADIAEALRQKQAAAKKAAAKAPAKKKPAKKAAAKKPALDEHQVTYYNPWSTEDLQDHLKQPWLSDKGRAHVREALRRRGVTVEPSERTRRVDLANTRLYPNARRDDWRHTESRAAAVADLHAQGEHGVLLERVLTDYQKDSGTYNVKRLRSALNNLASGQAQPQDMEDGARVWLETLKGMDAKTVPKELYRGMKIKGTPENVAKKFKVGSTEDVAIASYTDEPAVATRFSHPGPGQTRVIITMEGSQKAVPMRNMSASQGFADEFEWLTSGRMETTAVTVDKVRGIVNVKVRQIGIP